MHKVADVLADTGRLCGDRQHPFAGGQKSNQEKHYADAGKQRHGVFKANGFIAVAQNQHQRQQQRLNNKLRHHHSHKAVRRQAVTVGHIAG